MQRFQQPTDEQTPQQISMKVNNENQIPSFAKKPGAILPTNIKPKKIQKNKFVMDSKPDENYIQ